jgi:hypothetical protein
VSSRRRALAGLCCAVLASVAVGFAAGQTGGRHGSQASAAPAHGPMCATTGNAVERPAALPRNLLPPGTVLTSSKELGDGRTLVRGMVSRDFRSTVQFLVTKLPAAGYATGAGDAELAEAEALFTGNGVSGSWKVNGNLNCPGAVNLAVFIKASDRRR